MVRSSQPSLSILLVEIVMDKATLSENLEKARIRIRAAEKQHGRHPNSVKLLAVSKTKSLGAIALASTLGQKCFAENYLQEAQEKIKVLSHHNLEWHFIGAIQGNKAKLIAQLFSWVHSIDRISTAEKLSKHRPEDLPDLNVCIQINLDAEDSKAGLALEDAMGMVQAINSLPKLKCRGLMAIPEYSADAATQREKFSRLHDLFISVQPLCSADTLSMGMSGDFEMAIAEGATIVRLGTAIFGRRVTKH